MSKSGKIRPGKQPVPRDNGMSAAMKTAMAIIGVGLVTGTTLVIGMDQIMKRLFVNDEWPESEWSSDDWAEEELE